VDGFSAVETSILSHLNNFKQQKPLKPSGENGQQRHYDLLITYRLQIGRVAKSLRAKPSCVHPNDRCLIGLPHRRVGDWSYTFGDCVTEHERGRSRLNLRTGCLLTALRRHTISRCQRSH